MSNTLKVILATISLLSVGYFSLTAIVTLMWGGPFDGSQSIFLQLFRVLGPITLILYFLFLRNKQNSLLFWVTVAPLLVVLMRLLSV